MKLKDIKYCLLTLVILVVIIFLLAEVLTLALKTAFPDSSVVITWWGIMVTNKW